VNKKMPMMHHDPAEGKTGPRTLSEHLAEVKGQRMARFLSPEYAVLREVKLDEAEQTLEKLDGNARGLVIDGEVTQKMIDRMVGKGFEYVAARGYRGVTKRPLSMRLLKIT